TTRSSSSRARAGASRRSCRRTSSRSTSSSARPAEPHPGGVGAARSPVARVDAGVRSGHAEPMVPTRMKAAVYKGDRSIEVEDYPTPEVGPGDVLLEVSHCGVCGSDIHFVLEGWSAPNRVHGHEFSGTVVAVGDRVTGWAVGDAVVGAPSGAFRRHAH